MHMREDRSELVCGFWLELEGFSVTLLLCASRLRVILMRAFGNDGILVLVDLNKSVSFSLVLEVRHSRHC